MTQEDVIVLWKDANNWDVSGYKNTLEDLERFANLVAAKEREACAKVCDYRHDEWRFGDGEDSISGPKECAAAIRARGEA